MVLSLTASNLGEVQMKDRIHLLLVSTLALIVLSGPHSQAFAATYDEEAAAQSDEAASYQLVNTYSYPGFKIAQYDLGVLAHFSYMLYSGGECLVVDPGRDIATYIAAAKQENAKIIGVWLTHSHADFIAGHTEFAQRLQVPLHISQKAQAVYPHRALNGNDTLEVGGATVRFMETPGHTVDSMCGVVSQKSVPDKPLALLTGDTLFVGSVGRPDLLGEGMAASTLASMMFDSWTQKLSKLPDDVLILPAHGSGSLCGAHLSDVPSSTIGQQRASNAYLQYQDRGEFVAAILAELPEAPPYFAHNAAINRDGPELVQWELEVLPSIEPTTELTDPTKYYVIDVRDAQRYAQGHIPNSVNIALRGRFETWTGIMVPWDFQTVVTGSEKEIREAIYRLNRVGYKPQAIAFETWKQAELPMSVNQMITPRELHQQMQTPESPVVVDVRLPAEWLDWRIGTVLNIPLTKLTSEWIKLDKQQRVVAVCNSAYRSSLAVGILERNGFQQVSSMAGGGEAWKTEGLPVYSGKLLRTASSVTAGRLELAEPIMAAELSQLLAELPDTIQLVDIRSPDDFADYHLPGAENVDVADVIGNPAFRNGAVPLVIVDRDGSLAMMVAGILSQNSERPIRALVGGLQHYWDVQGVGAVLGAPAAAVGPAVPTARPSSPARAKPKKRRSAGC